MINDELRGQVVETARRMLEEGLVRGTWGNVSARIPESSSMLITPSGMDYKTMTPDDLVVVDEQGTRIEGRWKPSTEGPLHLAIYNSRPNVGAIVHTHSTFATAFAVARRPIPAITEEIAQVIGGPIDIAPYAACGSSDLATVAVRHLGQRMAVLLANHGLVGVGGDLKEALLACVIGEKTAKIATMAQILGGYSEFRHEQVQELRENFLYKYGQ
jgi:L-fuculose-phosphate aldolase